jgi:putative tryptophan/tyrosine transport system substrate-binding protein
MRRRDFIKGIAGPAMMWPLVGRAQQADGKAQVGVLGPSLDNLLARTGYEAFTAELQKLGFSQGKNLQLEYRRTDEGMDRAVTAARELVAAKANVIVAIGPEISLRAALAPNSGLPIVILAFNYDPIARGYVESLAHPGGNITGAFTRQPELAVKQLQLLVEAFPEKNQLGILWDDQTTEQFESAEQEAQKTRLAMKLLDGEIGRLPASQDLGNESRAAAIKRVRVHTIGHQAAGLDIKFKGEHRGKLVPHCQVCDFFTMRSE